MPRRFHTPGHAGFSLAGFLPEEVYRFDLSEVGDLDVLSTPVGILKEAQERAAFLYDVRDCFFLVNGASVGLTAAMLASLKPGDKVLLPRNIHRSVISGLILTGAIPVWMLPEQLPEWGLWGAVSPEVIDQTLDRHSVPASAGINSGGNPVKAVILTSPTYEGIGSDIEKISAICRQHNALLIIDEAHGALWPFSDQLPASAIDFDCDAVIQSLHKTGGSLTQTALAHLPKQSRIPHEHFQQALNTLQTTSPSYLLLAGLDATISWLASAEGEARIETLMHHTLRLRQDLQSSLKQLKLFDPATDRHSREGGNPDSRFDPTKLYFRNQTTPDNTDWANRLEYDHGMPYEAASADGVLYLANIGLQPEDFDYFLQTLQTEDRLTASSSTTSDVIPAPILKTTGIQTFQLPQMAMPPRNAFFAEGETIAREHAIGRVSKDTIVHCPPGIPVLFPGELISESHLSQLPDTVQIVR